MASVIYLNAKRAFPTDIDEDMYHSWIHHPYDANDAIIAKGNIIEGVRAVY